MVAWQEEAEKINFGTSKMVFGTRAHKPSVRVKVKFSKRLQFGYLQDRVAKKLDRWKNKYFSNGGREVLLKAVIQAISTYVMSCFRSSTPICGDIEAMCVKFWWALNQMIRRFTGKIENP